MYELKTLTDLPNASKEAVKFIEGITNEMTVPLIMKEELIFMSTSNTDDTDIGTFKINIGTGTVSNSPVLKFTQKVNFRYKNIDRSRLLICNIKPTMQLVELHLESHLHAKYHLSKDVNMVYDVDKMVVNLEYVIDGRQQSLENYQMEEDKVKEFVAPGQRFMLLKLFALKGSLPANLSFVELDSSNQFVTSTYTDLGKWKVLLDGNRVEVMCIERRLHSVNYVEVARYFFDEFSNLILRIEPGSDLYVAHPSLRNLDSIKHFFIDEQKSKVKFDWEKDLEMRSIHEYIKERVGGELSMYIYRRPEWKSIMADFLQQVLVDKPEDIVQYAVHHFTKGTD